MQFQVQFHVHHSYDSQGLTGFDLFHWGKLLPSPRPGQGLVGPPCLRLPQGSPIQQWNCHLVSRHHLLHALLLRFRYFVCRCLNCSFCFVSRGSPAFNSKPTLKPTPSVPNPISGDNLSTDSCQNPRVNPPTVMRPNHDTTSTSSLNLPAFLWTKHQLPFRNQRGFPSMEAEKSWSMRLMDFRA